MPLPPACSQLHGYELPASRPSPVYNRFVDLYTADGKALRFASLDEIRRVIPNPIFTLVLHVLTLAYPVTVPLNFPWAIGAPAGRDLDLAVQHALVFQLNGLDGAISRCDDHTMHKCPLTVFGRSTEDQRAHRDFIDERVRRQAQCVALFPEPYCITTWRKNSTTAYTRHGTAMERQNWFPWQTCTNCCAARAAVFCTHWKAAMEIGSVEEGGRVADVAAGQESQMERDHPLGDTMVEWIVSMETHT